MPPRNLIRVQRLRAMKRIAAAFFCSLSLCIVSVEAVGSDTIRERLDRVERMLGNKALMDLFERVDGLQREIRELRGQVEEQGYALSRMKQDQRNRYRDLDNRLQRLEVAAGLGTTPPPDTPGISREKKPPVPKAIDTTRSRPPAQKAPK